MCAGHSIIIQHAGDHAHGAIQPLASPSIMIGALKVRLVAATATVGILYILATY